MKKKPFILISNDDGINAPGIKHLWNALDKSGKYDLTIVAPHREKSGTSLATSLLRPLHIFNIKWEKNTPAWKVTGTPTDSIKIALSEILQKQPDMIVSGINRGSNAGRNVLYSGTVGCVIESVLRNIVGIAFSCYELYNPNYEIAEKYIPYITNYFLKNPPPLGTLINVTFPPKNIEIKGFKMAYQGKSKWFETPDKRLHPEGHYYYWLGGKLSKADELNEDKNSDVYLLNQGYITAVPIKVSDLTEKDYLQKHRDNFENLFNTI